MKVKNLQVFLCAAALAGAALAQTETQPTRRYLDVMTIKVKPDKWSDFETMAKRIADINRQYKGEHWLAMGTVFGEGQTVRFATRLNSYGDIEQNHQLFRHAMTEALTPSGFTRFISQIDNFVASSKRELRVSRPDLSFNAPSDPSEYDKLVGQARWVRTHAVRVRAGHDPEFESLVQTVKAAIERDPGRAPTFVWQNVLGSMGSLYYFTSLEKSLEGFDKRASLRELLGDEAFRKFMSGIADTSIGGETELYMFNPQLSNAPEQIAAADPQFWNPKQAPSASKRAPAAPSEQARAKVK